MPKQGGVSRRGLIRQVGMAGAAAAVSSTGIAQGAIPPIHDPVPRREARETLNATEADALDAIVARLIPSDENGPGATEAHAAVYIDRQLAGPIRNLRATYAAGLAAIDEYAQSKKGAVFAKLSAADQDTILTEMEKNTATGFTPNSAAFFNMLRTHTIEGTFCDPYYGGNANFAGWDLIGYPGLRMGVTAAEQRMTKPEAVRASAYDDPMFGRGRGDSHGH